MVALEVEIIGIDSGSGFGFQVSGFGFQVASFGFMLLSYKLQVENCTKNDNRDKNNNFFLT
jgi:hypothetical protein